MPGLPPTPPADAVALVEPAVGAGVRDAQRPLDFSGAFVSLPAPEAGQAATPEALAEKLLPLCFGERAFFVPSEAWAWTAAAQTVRRFHQISGRPRRRRLLFCAGLSGGPANAVLPPGLATDDDVAILRTDDPGAVLAAIDAKTAALVIAPLRPRNGLEAVDGALLATLREAADDYGLALIFDETEAGFGRTGMMFAHEWTGVTPDVMIAGGDRAALPLAALVTTQKFVRGAPASLPAAEPSAHAEALTLFAGVLTRGFEARIQGLAWRLEDRLAELALRRRDLFSAVRGVGLAQALVCAQDAETLRQTLAARGLTTRPIPGAIGLFPPLDITETEIDAAAALIEDACEEQG